jgi:hypothetical protein
VRHAALLNHQVDVATCVAMKFPRSGSFSPRRSAAPPAIAGCISRLGSSERDVAAILPKAGHEARADPCRIGRVAGQRLH